MRNWVPKIIYSPYILSVYPNHYCLLSIHCANAKTPVPYSLFISFKKMNQLSATTKQWLITKGFDNLNLNKPGENGDTALIKATREGADTVVEELIKAGADINARNNDGNNALWFACFGNYYNLIKLLLAANINLDNQNDNGATALMYAASTGKIEVLKRLLQYHPDLDLKNLDDYKAIDFASTVEIFRILKGAVV